MILFSVLIVLLLIILAFVVFTGIRIIPQNMVGMVSVLGSINAKSNLDYTL